MKIICYILRYGDQLLKLFIFAGMKRKTLSFPFHYTLY